MNRKLSSIRYCFYIFLATLLSLTIASCHQSRPIKVGVSQCSSDDWRDKMNAEIMREALLMGDTLDITIVSEQDSNQKQIADLQKFMDEGYDIIAVAPNEAEELTPIINKIYQAGIPVILFDRSINGDNFTAYQGTDNMAMGAQAAKLAYSYHPNLTKVLEIKGLKGSTPAEDRRRGFHIMADSLGIEVIEAGYGNWNYLEAKALTDSMLRIYPDINIIYAHNDRMAMGASAAASELGLRENIKIIGIDAAPEIGIQAIIDGVIDASFVYPTEGGALVRLAHDIVYGKDFDRFNYFPTPAAVDKSNAELLMMQEQALKRETAKISTLKDRLDIYWEQHSLQTIMLYSAIIILVLLAGLIFMLLRTYWSHKRHRMQVEKQNQELQRQRDELNELYTKLQDATASKLTFFTNVSHDLRTPLTLISDPIHQMAHATNLTPQQKVLMQLADKNAKRLQRLINQILDIRKYDNGQLKLNLANYDLSVAVQEWCKPFAEAAKKRHLHFVTDIPENANAVMAFDLEKIERVLFNLLSNAFKFTRENGEIKVSFSVCDNNAIIIVKDTGIGIPKDEIDRIFQRFFKTDQINPNGSGIGLALSKVFVDMHGGNITVESIEGQGTTFVVSLPMRQVEAPMGEIEQSAQVATADIAELEQPVNEDLKIAEDAPRVLVIDDNEDIRTLVKSILCDKFAILQAAGGEQGLKLAMKYTPDLIICDVMMPGIDGYETCKRLKAEALTSHIPVLLLTACSRDEQRTLGYECGVDGYMSKPFDSEMLSARCQALIQNRKRIYAMQGAGSSSTAASTAQPTLPKDDIDNEFYNKFIDLVNREIANSEISVEDIAQALGLSRVQMYRKLKSLTNYSPAELLRNQRLRKGAQLIKTTEMTIAEVTYAVGFTSPSYFTKCYKEFFNETPQETRK